MLLYRAWARAPEFVEVAEEVLAPNNLVVVPHRHEISFRHKHLLRTEHVWEPLFSAATVVLVCWYLFWLDRALHNLSLVSDPALLIF